MSVAKIEAKVKELQKKPTNKSCFDCGKAGVQSSTVLPFGVFVCDKCSGIHRKFPGHQVNTVSATSYSATQLKLLEENGNKKMKSIALATYGGEKDCKVDPADLSTVEAFIKLAFVDKKWWDEGGEGVTEKKKKKKEAGAGASLDVPGGSDRSSSLTNSASSSPQV